MFSRLDPPADIVLDVKRNTPNDGQQRPLFRLFRPSEIYELNDVIRGVVGTSKSEAPSCHIGEGGLPVTVQNSYTPNPASVPAFTAVRGVKTASKLLRRHALD